MPKAKKILIPWDISRLRFSESLFSPHALAIGQVALTWNELHEMAGSIFRSIFTPRKEMAGAVWQACTSDRVKRELLRVAIKETTQLTKRFPRLQSDIEWFLSKADRLEDLRNDIIHAPISRSGYINYKAKMDEDELVTVVASKVDAGNRRALKLAEKDLLSEYRYCRDATAHLIRFLLGISVSIHHRQVQWPERPAMPGRKRRKARKSKKPPKRLPIELKKILLKLEQENKDKIQLVLQA